MKGFVFLHRKMIENPIMKRPYYLSVWIYLLLKANHKDKSFIFNNKITIVKRGQLISSIKSISEYFNLGIATVSRILSLFEDEGMIKKHSNNKFTRISICNYDEYQGKKPSLEPMETEDKSKTEKTETKKTAESLVNKGLNEFQFEKWKTSGKQAETNNNDNNDNIIYIAPLQKFINENLPTVSKMKKQLTNSQINKLLEKYSEEQIKDKLEQMENYKKLKSYTSVYLTLKNWLKRTPQNKNIVNEILRAY